MAVTTAGVAPPAICKVSDTLDGRPFEATTNEMLAWKVAQR